MADDRHYVPGDFYRICERTGFKIRAKRTRMEWTGRIVRDQSWEARQPQDFVRGTVDDQTVPSPRPRQIDLFVNQDKGVAEVQVYADISARSGVQPMFLVQNQRGPSYNTGINEDSNYQNPGGTAEVQVFNGTIPQVLPQNYPPSDGSGFH